jgi:hypothetical protein
LYLSVSQAGRILSEFNNTEPDMDKLELQSLKEAAWRSRLLRHSQSGKSIAAFCRDESVSTASFHIWRAKLAAADGRGANAMQQPAFIDLGAIKDTVGASPTADVPALVPAPTAEIDVRIDLGAEVVLTVTRR